MPFEVFDPQFSRLKLIVAGLPGAGKTRWARSWPWPIWLDAEGRLLSIRKDKPRTWKLETSKDLDEFVRVIKQDRDILERKFGGPVETINVDTLDEICRMFIQERKAATGHEMQRDDWGWLKDRIGDFVRALRNLDMHVLFSVHLTDSVISDDPKRVEYWPQISGAMKEEIFNFVDVAVLMESRARHDTNGERLVRTLKTFPSAEYPWVKEHTGDIPNNFEVNFEDDWSRLAKKIWGAVPDPATPLSDEAKIEAEKHRTEIEAVAADLARQEEEAAAAELRRKAAEAKDTDDDIAALRSGKAATKSKPKESPAKVEKESAEAKDEKPAEKPKRSRAKAKTEEASAPAADAPADETPPAENETSAPASPGEVESQPEQTPENPPESDEAEVPSEDQGAAEVPAAEDSEGTGEATAEPPAQDESAETEGDPQPGPEPSDDAPPQPPEGIDPETGEVLQQPAADVPGDGTEYVPVPCSECGDLIENEDIADLSVIRYQVPLCPTDFAKRKKKR